MGRSPTTLTKLKLGKLKVVRCQLLQRYEHQPFISCLAGLYGCQWKRYQRARAQPGECCCNRLECCSFGILILAFCLSLVFLYFWSEAQNDYNDFDWFNYESLGYWFPWSMVLLVVAAVLFTYVALLLVSRAYFYSLCILSLKAGLGIFTLVLALALTMVLSPWPWLSLVQRHLQIFSDPFYLPTLNDGINVCSWLSPMKSTRYKRLFVQCIRQSPSMFHVLIMGVYLMVLFTLYLVPLGMYSPCIKEEGTLGPAPALIGHRGAPMLAPENTRMSFAKAIEFGGEGLETDVTISYDGVPFLMHDRDLKRTTNVHEVFPNRTTELASMFTLGELEMLNAGEWFISGDPFGTKALLSVKDQRKAENQSIMNLSDFLNQAATHHRLVIFNLCRPPQDHPYRDSWISRTLEVISNESSIDPSLVLWLPNVERSLVQDLIPGMQHTSEEQAPVEELQKNHIVKLNLHYSQMSAKQVSKYAAANITTNLYVVSQPWLYSLAWCSGAHSVTTNAVHILKNLSQPLFLMTPHEYNLMWILTDVVSAFLILVVFVFHW
ncbi:GDPD5 protein, partial [Polyodon spathula]|nr:GDPD5 protein [Polyodon spathula]